jgi:outer membrane protein TolC
MLSILTACMVGPNYVKPRVDTPVAFKEVAGWRFAEPKDHLPRGAWWEIFNDPQLNALEEKVDISNQNLAVAAAQYRQALAAVKISRAAFFPTVTAGPSASDTRISSNLGGSGRLGAVGHSIKDYQFSGTTSWEPDIWGKVRRQVESSKASAQASAADLEGVRLSAHALLAQDYFQLRTLDAQKKILDDSVAS